MALGVRAVVGFGANLGDRLATLRKAAAMLAREVPIGRTSRVYRTAPVGESAKYEFLNAAALVRSEATPEALLNVLLSIEAELGRVRREKWGPRTIDLDLLWVEGVVLQTPRLTLPHPALTERAFALVPMLELLPDAVDPRTGERYVAPTGEVWPTEDVL